LAKAKKKNVEETQEQPRTLDTLGRGSRDSEHKNMVIHGRSGAGKTYRAATAPKPFIMAFDPRGHDSIPMEVPGKVVEDLKMAENILEWFEEGGHKEYDIKTLVVDGLNAYYDMLYEEKGREMVSQDRAPGVDRMPYGGGMEVFRPYKRFLTRLVRLTQVRPIENRVHVIITTLDEQVKEAEQAPFNIRPQFGSKSMNQNFPALFSIIAYIAPEGEEYEDEETGELVVSQERRMLFTEYAGILARDRTGTFPLRGPAPNLSEYLK